MCVRKILTISAAALLLPAISHAQGISDSIYSLNAVLDRLFDEMLPQCKRMIDVGRAIAGFAALTYIATRVWKHLAKAEAIEFFPLLRPFAIGLAIILFPSLIALMNGVLEPVTAATAEMSKDSSKAILYNIIEQEKSVTRDAPVGLGAPDTKEYDKYKQTGDNRNSQGMLSRLGDAFNFLSIKSIFKVVVFELVQIIYVSAGLCINIIRTFYLIVLAIIGPLVLGLSVFEGFGHTLSSWIARYINVYMWLPVANIFGGITSKVLENMMTLDQNFASTVAYIIFMIISVVGYTTIPNVAGYIIQAGGKDTLLHKINSYSKQAGMAAVKAVV